MPILVFTKYTAQEARNLALYTYFYFLSHPHAHSFLYTL